MQKPPTLGYSELSISTSLIKVVYVAVIVLKEVQKMRFSDVGSTSSVTTLLGQLGYLLSYKKKVFTKTINAFNLATSF